MNKGKRSNRKKKGDASRIAGEAIARASAGEVTPKAAQRPQIIAQRMEELCRLKNRVADAGESFRAAIKKAASDSGYLEPAVRGFIAARAALKSAKRRTIMEQQLELFAECPAFGGDK